MTEEKAKESSAIMGVEAGKIDTTPLITHRFPLSEINEAYHIFENKSDGVIKISII